MKKQSNKGIFYIGILYGITMLWLMLFQRIGGNSFEGYFVQLSQNYNVKPGETIRTLLFIMRVHEFGSKLVEYAVINMVGNTILFFPMGYFLPFYFKRLRSFRIYLQIQILLIIILELIQFITLLGKLDVDDLILNTLGGLVGYIYFKCTYKTKVGMNNNEHD